MALNKSFLDSRSAILEGAGYEVVPALSILEVETTCEKHQSFDLVIIGPSLPKQEKRRVMRTVRQFCGPTLMLELYPHGTEPVDEEADEQLPSPEEANTLLAKVEEVLSKKRKRGRAAP